MAKILYCLTFSLVFVKGSKSDNLGNLVEGLYDGLTKYKLQGNEVDISGSQEDQTAQPIEMLPQMKQAQILYANIKIDKVMITLPSPPVRSQRLSVSPQLKSSDSSPHDKFEDLRNKWRSFFIYKDFDESDIYVAKFVNTLSKEAEELYETLNKGPNRKYLWPVQPEDTPSADVNRQFQKIRKLTLAYSTNGTTYYKDPKVLLAVKNGLDFMVKQSKYDGKKLYGNWWHWQVAAATNFIDILMILKDEMPFKKIQLYTNLISNYVLDPYRVWKTSGQEDCIDIVSGTTVKASGSQQAGLTKTLLGLGILQKNKTKIIQAMNSTVELFQLLTKNYGFYHDVSFNRYIPYLGSYGNELLKKMGQILIITKGSKFEVASELVQAFVECVEKTFLPLIYRGEMIAPVLGRAITRPPHQAKTGRGSDTMYNLLNVAEFGRVESKKHIKESVKFWMRQNVDYYLSNARNYNELVMTVALLNDSTIVGDNLPYVGTKMYPSMDRFVQRTQEYILSISLYSERISAFEAGNKENKRGWHTADGAIYFYNDDDVQFTNSYWPTVDPYRIPGITVDTTHLNDELSFNLFTSDEKWVGGVTNENQAVVGMALNKAGMQNNGKRLSMDLKAKKSWFVVDGQIVALGAGITGTTTASIETIVDNRLLNDFHNYTVLSNRGETNVIMERIKVDWILLEVDYQPATIAYYFPDGETVDVISETRSGTYSDINEDSDSQNYTGTYQKFIIDHGQSPIDAKYAYVVLPGFNESELKDYAKSESVKILENSANIQAVQIVNKEYLGINIWTETGGEIAGISSNKPVCLMRQSKGNENSYVLSDPTQSDNVITIKIPNFARVSAMSEGIYYDIENNKFVIDFTNSGGASKYFTVHSN